MDTELINSFIKATLNVLSTMAQTSPVAGTPQVRSDNKTSGDVTGIIGMAGEEVSGCMVLSFDEPSIVAIVSRLLGENFTEMTPEVLDAVGEITNMITGGAKAGLQEYQFNMATPIILTGRGIAIRQLSQGSIIRVPFRTPEGEFTIDANLVPIVKPKALL